ncbi:retrovirus-related Pol polyprotein from transposon TNT 1-94 [Trichonephila clavipes]|nr:retrovirus-related Pol polyprotein from transposon TNT 1-94 [Trichonephila clavipes]
MEFNNQISVLTQNNWNTWKHDMQVILMHYGCWQFIIQTKLEQPDEEATYKEKLDLQLREDVGIFISRVKTAATRLQEVGHKLDDLCIGFQLIRWLPQEFQSTVQQIYRWKEEDFRVVKIEAELILEANCLQLMKQDLEKAENAYLSSFTSKKSKTFLGATAAAHGDPNGKKDYQKKGGKVENHLGIASNTFWMFGICWCAKTNLKKLDMRAKMGIMMGYGQRTKGYRIWLIDENKLVETINGFSDLSEATRSSYGWKVTIPNCYKQAIRSRDASKWHGAMDKEINVMKEERKKFGI